MAAVSQRTLLHNSVAMDKVFDAAGHFGRYQLIAGIVPLLSNFLSAFTVLAPIYILFDPQHRCQLPVESGWHSNDTMAVQNAEHLNVISIYIPASSSNSSDKFDSCKLMQDSTNSTCDQWVHDKSSFESTIVTELQLFCTQKHLKTLLSTCSFAGILVGVLVSGYVSDWIGRRKCLLLMLWIQTCSLIASLFVVSPTYTAIVRFLVGFAALSQATVCYVMYFELVGVNARHHVVSVFGYFWSAGTVLVALTAYLTGDWHSYTIVTLCLSIVILFAAHVPQLAPETPRWLMTRGKLGAAARTVRKMASLNGANNCEQIVQNFVQEAKEDVIEADETVSVMESLKLLMKSPRLLMQYAVLWIGWFVVATVYYGLSLGSKNLPGSIFVTSAMLGACEFPSYLLMHLTAGKIGRKTTFIGAMCLAGIALLMLAVVFYFAKDIVWLTLMCSLIGKTLNSTAFGIIYIWTSELYPTNMRSAGLGICSTWARVGTLCAPLLGNIRDFIPGDFGPIVTYLLFCAASFTAALLACVVPETFGKPTPDTLQDLIRQMELSEAEKNDEPSNTPLDQ